MRGKEMFKRVAPDELDNGDIFILPPDKKTNKLRLSSRVLSSQVKLQHRDGLYSLDTCITKAPSNEMFVVTDTMRQELSRNELISYYAMNTTQLNIANKKPIRRVFFRPLTSMTVPDSRRIRWLSDVCKEILGKVDPTMLNWWRCWDIGKLLADRDFDTTQIPDLANSVLHNTSAFPNDNIPMMTIRQSSRAPSRLLGKPEEVLDALRSGTLLSSADFLNDIAEAVFDKLVDNWDTPFPRSKADIVATDFPAFKKWLERGAIIVRPVSKEALSFLLYEMFRHSDRGLAQSNYATNISSQTDMEEAALKKLKEACAYDLRRLKQRKKYWLKFPQQLKKRGQKAAIAFEEIIKERPHD